MITVCDPLFKSFRMTYTCSIAASEQRQYLHCLMVMLCAQMAQYYELVVYTDQLPTYADPILDRLDPQRFIQYRLYRDSTQYINGKHVSASSLLKEAS